MTRALRLALLASPLPLLLLACVSPASAHGPAPPREIDLRLLTDDDGLVGYGGCLEDDCVPGEAPGLDLLSLDVRETVLPDGTPCVAFRVTFLAAEPGEGRLLRITFEANGQTVTADVHDPDTVPAAAAERVEGPRRVGDGHALAVEVWLAWERIGASEGTELSSIQVRSLTGDTPEDDMPGGWYRDGRPVPHLPHDPADPGEAVAEPEPAAYTLAGPQRTLRAVVPGVPVMEHVFTFDATSALQDLDQNVTVTVRGPPGSEHAVDPPSFVLEPNSGQRIVLNANATGELHVRLYSDLGSAAWFIVQATQALPQNGTSGTGDSGADGEPGKQAPPVPVAVLLAAVAAAAVRRRRGA